jgi:hypothetical protein
VTPSTTPARPKLRPVQRPGRLAWSRAGTAKLASSPRGLRLRPRCMLTPSRRPARGLPGDPERSCAFRSTKAGASRHMRSDPCRSPPARAGTARAGSPPSGSSSVWPSPVTASASVLVAGPVPQVSAPPSALGPSDCTRHHPYTVVLATAADPHVARAPRGYRNPRPIIAAFDEGARAAPVLSRGRASPGEERGLSSVLRGHRPAERSGELPPKERTSEKGVVSHCLGQGERAASRHGRMKPDRRDRAEPEPESESEQFGSPTDDDRRRLAACTHFEPEPEMNRWTAALLVRPGRRSGTAAGEFALVLPSHHVTHISLPSAERAGASNSAEGAATGSPSALNLTGER